MADRMGDMGDPCGALWFSMTSGRGSLLNMRVILLSVRKDWTQSQSCGAKPRREKTWTR